MTDIVRPDDGLVMVVGNYGSGKTEIAVNLAIQLAEAGRSVHMADLDIVNPYFRSREARRLMETHGIRVVVPPGAQAFADLPIILPELYGMLHPRDGLVSLFDVGGDDVGAKALASFRPAIGDEPYQLLQVVNAMRPFTSTVEGCLDMQHSIEGASRLAVTGYVANAHLIQDTTPETVLAGWRLARDLSAMTGKPVRAVAVMDEIADDPSLDEIEVPLLRMKRHMLPPWMAGAIAEGEERLPAARSIPIGKPRPLSIPRRARGTEGENHGTHRD